MKSLIIGILLFPLLGFAPTESVSMDAMAIYQNTPVEPECKCPPNPNEELTWLFFPASKINPTPTCVLLMIKLQGKRLVHRKVAEIPARCN